MIWDLILGEEYMKVGSYPMCSGLLNISIASMQSSMQGDGCIL